MFERHQLLLQLLVLVACRRLNRVYYGEHLEWGVLVRIGLWTNQKNQRFTLLTTEWPAALLSGCGTRCRGRWCRVRLGKQAKGGLLLVMVVSMVHYTQVHGKDGCVGRRHLRGQCWRAHVHWRRRSQKGNEKAHKGGNKGGVCEEHAAIKNLQCMFLKFFFFHINYSYDMLTYTHTHTLKKLLS